MRSHAACADSNLRFVYAQSAGPFYEMRRKIDADEEPYECPPGYEDAESPFLSARQDADDALDVLGQSLASLVSQTLKLYLDHWIADMPVSGRRQSACRKWCGRTRRFRDKEGVTIWSMR